MSAPAEETPSEGCPEWMVSYADMITIMMAFFVVMYAMAGVKDPKKEEPVMASMRRQFGKFAASPSGPKVPSRSKLAGVGDGFQKLPETPKGNSPEKLLRPRPADQLTLGAVLYFEDGGSALPEAGREQLRRAAEEMAGKPQKIEIRGHSPKDARGDNPWDLSYARARGVMDFLVSTGIDPRRIRISVAGQFEPMGADAQPALLKKNARVEVFMLNEFVDNPLKRTLEVQEQPAPAAEPVEHHADEQAEEPHDSHSHEAHDSHAHGGH